MSKKKDAPKSRKKKKSNPPAEKTTTKSQTVKKSVNKSNTKSPDEEAPPLQLDQTAPPEPPEPRTIPSKYLPLDESQRTSIRENLTNRRTETLIRRLLDAAMDGLPAEGDRRKNLPGLTTLTDTIRGIGTTDDESASLTPEKLVQDLTRLGQALRLPFHVTPLISRQEIFEASEADESEAAKKPWGTLSAQQSYFDPNTFRPVFDSVEQQLFSSRDTANLFAPMRLVPPVPREGQPAFAAFRFTMRPGGRYVLYVVLEDVAEHFCEFEPIKLDGQKTLEEINRPLDFQLLAPLPGRGSDMTVTDWFNAQNSSTAPGEPKIKARQLVIQRTKDGKQYQASEWVGEKSLQDVVLEAWRHQQAHLAARKRAETLAKRVREADSDQDLVDLLGDEPLLSTQSDKPAKKVEQPEKKEDPAKKDEETGTPPDPEQTTSLRIVTSGRFPWLSSDPLRTAPQGIPGQGPLRISEVPGLPVSPGGLGAGGDFMRAVFAEASEGDVVVTSSADHRAVYIARIRDRSPKDPPEEADYVAFQKDSNLLERGNYQAQRSAELRQFLQRWLMDFQKQALWDGRISSDGR